MTERDGKELGVLCADEKPCPVLFRKCEMPENAFYPVHAHAWGEFVYSFSGVVEITIDGKRYLILPNYGIWIPRNLPHQCFSKKRAFHCSIYVAEAFCAGLSATPCSVEISPLMRSMLQHLHGVPVCDNSEEYVRFLRVFIDQLHTAPCTGSYLPTAADEKLASLLAELEENPADGRSAKELALSLGFTEKTFARKCKRELGVTLPEWRQRVRIIKALGMLEDGVSVEQIAFELGYSGASAFIAMFKRVMGKTPAEFHPVAGFYDAS